MGQGLSQPKWRLLTAFLALLVAAQAVHWLITPAESASASNARWWAVVAQAVLGIAVAVWFLCTARRRALKDSSNER